MCNKASYKVYSFWKTKQIFRGGCGSPAIFRIILFVKSKQLEVIKKCYRGFWRNCKLIPRVWLQSIDIIRQWDSPTLSVSKDHLEEGDGEFTTNFDNPMEGDSASIILELLKKAVFIDADKNCEGSG